VFGDAGLLQPEAEGVQGHSHGSPSRARVREVVYPVGSAS
jgi:hypothetical protein